MQRGSEESNLDGTNDTSWEMRTMRLKRLIETRE